MQRRTFVSAGAGLGALASAPHFACAAATRAPGESVPAITGAAKRIMLPRPDVEQLRKTLTGPLLLRGDDGYDGARRVWNISIDRKPALIARCKNAMDVMKAVRFTKAHDLLIAVRGGGHSSAGKSVCDEGIMLDLSLMRGVTVDASSRTAKVEGGALLGDLDRASQAHGLATTAGTVSHTGVGGLTLGGGMGHLGRQYGLTIDNLLSVDMVTADGKLLHANAKENADLFWAVRGGGGNFGVATAFEFRLHEFGTQIVTGSLVYPWPVARKVLAFLEEYRKALPDEATVTPVMLATPDGARILVLGIHYAGGVSDADALLAPLRKVATPVRTEPLKSIPYLTLQTQSDDGSAKLVHGYLKSGFINALDEKFIEAVISAVEDSSTPPLTPIVMPQVGGAIARVDVAATAFPHRNAAYAVLFDLRWEDPAQSDRMVAWARAAWKRLEPSMRGVYVNFTAGDDAQMRIRETYATNYERLAILKKKYDPTNLFRLNANIEPS